LTTDWWEFVWHAHNCHMINVVHIRLPIFHVEKLWSTFCLMTDCRACLKRVFRLLAVFLDSHSRLQPSFPSLFLIIIFFFFHIWCKYLSSAYFQRKIIFLKFFFWYLTFTKKLQTIKNHQWQDSVTGRQNSGHFYRIFGYCCRNLAALAGIRLYWPHADQFHRNLALYDRIQQRWPNVAEFWRKFSNFSLFC
jgi:hypothetical protein